MPEQFTIPGTGLQRFARSGEDPAALLGRLLAQERLLGSADRLLQQLRLKAPRGGGLAAAMPATIPTGGRVELRGGRALYIPPTPSGPFAPIQAPIDLGPATASVVEAANRRLPQRGKVSSGPTLRDFPVTGGLRYIRKVAPSAYPAIARKLNAGADISAFTPQEQQLLLQGADWAGRELDRQYVRSKQRSALSGISGKVALAAAGGLLGATGAIGNITRGLSSIGSALSGGTSASANAVPGISTGVTTPAGGGAIVGTGQAAPLQGLVGGAPLGASPLAVAGGAAPAALFPRFPSLGSVSPLPSGQLPGTNIIVGSRGTTASDLTRLFNILKRIPNLGGLPRLPSPPTTTGQAGGAGTFAGTIPAPYSRPVGSPPTLFPFLGGRFSLGVQPNLLPPGSPGPVVPLRPLSQRLFGGGGRFV